MPTLTVGELWAVLDYLHKRGHDDMPVWTAQATLETAVGVSTEKRGRWRGVYVGRVGEPDSETHLSATERR